MIYDNVVVGTGLSALGCILGLIKNNKKVLCIDASNELEDLGKTDDKDVIFCNQGLPLRKIRNKKIKNKLFDPVEIVDNHFYGGLSNIWGGNALRPFANEFDEWPLSYDLLKPYFDKCETIMNISHFDDKFSKKFKIEEEKFNKSKKLLFSDFIKNFLLNDKTENKDFIYGLARLTLEENSQISENYFFGCKDENIFNSKNEIKRLVNEKKIELKSNMILEKVNFDDDKLKLIFKNDKVNIILTKKLFLGTGPINTPKIILNSLKQEKKAIVKESQPFFIPCFYTGRDFNNNKKHHTLSQAQIVFNSKNNNDHNTYYEVKYDFNLINSIIKIKYGFLYYLIPNFLKKRLFVITGFINSKESSFEGEIKDNNDNLLIIKKEKMLQYSRKKILDQLKTLGKAFSFISIKPLLKFGSFGRGFHLGGSLPMKKTSLKEDDLFTNPNGEFSAMKNLFIIDSSNFTNIPASGFSLTIMANAFRIADTSCSND